MVFSTLAIGAAADGFDLDGDGEADNKFAAVASLANTPIEESIESLDIVLPMEFFDLDEVEPDSCVKFALYQGVYRLDADEDGIETVGDGGDCNDTLMAVNPAATEVADNGIDDDCDGIADEEADNTPSTDTSDGDSDGVTLADGDCDDTNDQINPGLDEICGDGLDNNCDGVADWTVGAAVVHCSPFDSELDPIAVSDASFKDDGSPLIAFPAGELVDEGSLKFRSGPSLFSLVLPLVDGIDLELRITGTTIEADMVMGTDGYILENGRLGGILDSYTLDQVRGLDVEEIGLRPEDSFADALYANVLGVLLGLRKAPAGTPGEGCLTPDIDVDGDGLEAFCDTTPDTEPFTVDMCVDGDGTVFMDDGDTQCTEALDDEGNRRFVDGVSIAITFDTLPATLPAALQ